MVIKYINIGVSPNDKTGTPARQAGQIINDNFDYLNNRIATVQNPDMVLKKGDIETNGLNVHVDADAFEWRINLLEFVDNPEYNAVLDSAEDGYYRKDVLLGNDTGGYHIFKGVEDPVSATEPNLFPNGTIKLGVIDIYGATVIGVVVPIDDFEKVVNKATDFTTVNNDLYPTVEAVKMYADNLLVGVINLRGTWDASANLFPISGGSGTSGAIQKGDLWYVSVAGVLAGKSVNVGDSFFALTNVPNQTPANWNVIESNIGYVPANDANVLHAIGNESFSGLKSSTNTTNSQSSGLDLTNNGGAPGSTVFKITNSSTGRGGQVTNSGGGSGFFIINNSNGNGLASVNNGIGNAFTSANNSSGTGFAASNTSTGSGIYSVNDSSGIGIISNGSSGSTGFVFAGQNNGSNTFTLTKTGDVVLNSLTVTTLPPTSVGAYDILTRNNTTGVLEKISSSSFALDSNAVHKTGPEGIGGVKTFSDYIQFSTDVGIASGGASPIIMRSGNHIGIASTTLSGVARLDTKAITGTPKTFAFPNKDGVFAMTSDLPVILTGTATLDFPNTDAGTSQDLTITVAGAAIGDVVSLGVPFASVEPNTVYTAFVSAPNTVTVRFGNLDTSVARNPASGDFKIKVFK
ncbi:hypothetical protein [Flavobacterium sp. CFS9]